MLVDGLVQSDLEEPFSSSYIVLKDHHGSGSSLPFPPAVGKGMLALDNTSGFCCLLGDVRKRGLLSRRWDALVAVGACRNKCRGVWFMMLVDDTSSRSTNSGLSLQDKREQRRVIVF